MNTGPVAVTPPTHGLQWAVKRSFTDYVRRMADGRAWLGEGAQPLDEHVLLWPAVRADRGRTADGRAALVWSFAGTVRFSGHAGMLQVQVAEPVLSLVDGRAVLSIAGSDDDRLDLVTLALERDDSTAGVEVWVGSEVRLTAAGVPLFNDVYAEGERFDPLAVVLPRVGTAR